MVTDEPESPWEIVTTRRFDDVEPGERLDKWLAKKWKDRSRTEIQRWIKEGLVRVNGRSTKPGYKLEEGDVIEVDVPAPQKYEGIKPEPLPLPILYQDDDIVVIDKPAGKVVHPAPGHAEGTLVNALLYHIPDLQGIGGIERPGIVHRLDKDTSGLLLVAKNDQAHRELQRQFKNREVEKMYLALVEGQVHPRVGRIEVPIARDKQHRKRMAPSKEGREAITEYRVLEYLEDFTFLEVRPLTGRTHQIRVHLAYIGHPIVGDTVYGRRKQRLKPFLKRHFLHAHRLRFRHPRTGTPMEFTSPLPPDLQAVINYLRSVHSKGGRS